MNLKLPFEPKILAYSTSWVNNPIMTVLVPVPTVKLAELRTHRLFHQFDGEVYELATNDLDLSMNANSSRAIPIQKQLEGCFKNPYVPIWTRNQKGMQGEVIESDNTEDLTFGWLAALGKHTHPIEFSVADFVQELINRNVHKQDASLLLNPFSWTTCVLSGDKAAWENWFDLRCPKYQTPVSTTCGFANSKKELLSWHGNQENLDKMNDPSFNWDSINFSMTYRAIQVIAEKLFDLWTFETPVYLEEGQWHAAFVDGDYLKTCQESEITTALKASMSKCALISYDNQENTQSAEQHIERANSLISRKHHSTAEHQYQVPTRTQLRSEDFEEGYKNFIRDVPTYHKGKYMSNVKGWIQLRKLIENGEF